jgi:anti-anti-sigma factor
MLKTDKASGDYVVIKASSYLSGRSGEELEKEFDKNMEQGRLNFVVNFRDTDIINSIGISILIGIIEKTMEKKGSIYFTNLSRVNEELFRMMGLLRYAPLIRDQA